MKVILVGKQHGRTRSFTVSGWTKALLSLCILGVPMGIGALFGYQITLSAGTDVFTQDTARIWDQALQEQKQDVETTRREAETHLAALTLRMAELQARLLRLDALGERMTGVAKLDSGEFNFSQPPAVGGPETEDLGDAYSPPDFVQAIDTLSEQIEDREQQLATLEAMLAKQKIQNDIFIAGRPVKQGWISSRYGRRTDPFKGHVAWHDGVDFSGKIGSDIISVAAGVVTFAEDRNGYGLTVEINHGNGFSTRYGHNSKNLVSVGDVVKKGQVIALLGNSGRSTGPHVHFEVYKNGRAVDPASYIHRTSR